MLTEAEPLTESNELICSTNIERIITTRNTVLNQITTVIEQLHRISQLTNEIGAGDAEDWAMRQGHRYHTWLTEPVAVAIKAITTNIDRSVWRDLMLKSGMLSLMDAQARSQWEKDLEQGDLPAINEANIFSTFEQLHANKQKVFERGIINLFKGLSWDYKTNSPCGFGHKLIINGLVSYNRWGYSLNWGGRCDQLADLERMLFLLDGKPIPDNRHDVTQRLMEVIQKQSHPQRYEDDYFIIRYFQKGSAHITFKRIALVEKMNAIVAKYYPGMLATAS